MGRKRIMRLGAAFAFGLALITFSATTVTAHPDMQHGGDTGHLEPVQEGVNLLGKLDLFGNDEEPGRISDVGSYGNYAYLGVFASPRCEQTGVYVIDISNPTAPVEVGFIPADEASFAGEGVQVLDMDTESFTGQVLIHSNETCIPGGNPTNAEEARLGGVGPGGASIWDVTNPLVPELLASHVGDRDISEDSATAGIPHNSHSTFGWQQGDKAYMLVVDNGEMPKTDIDIFDITDPSKPELIREEGMARWPKQDCNPNGADDACRSVAEETPPPNGDTPMIHDFVVKQIGNKYYLLASYWDAGYVILDVTNPAQPVFLGDSDFGLEPFQSELGIPDTWTAEGNGHQAEFSRDGSLFLAADEDFDPKRSLGTILGTGKYAGDSFTANLGDQTPNVPEGGLTGPVIWQDKGCAAMTTAPDEPAYALVERGGCTFQIKLDNADRAGYEAVILFNDMVTAPSQCPASVNPAAAGDIPFLSVSRATGLKIMDADFTGEGCTTLTPTEAVGTPQEPVQFAAQFDGWGYLHLYDASAATGASASGADPVKLQAIDHWALPESLDKTKAEGFGDLSIHEVAMDPDEDIAYSSHYAGGFRVFAFDRTNGIREVGAFIDQGGSNFWGVEVLQHPDPNVGKIVLASDRDAGLYIFGAAAPDLTVTSITRSGARRVGQRGTLTATVSNIGALDASDVEVVFKVFGVKIGETQTIPSIAAGGTGVASVTWRPNQTGQRRIEVYVDLRNRIAELDESNNRANKYFTVHKR